MNNLAHFPQQPVMDDRPSLVEPGLYDLEYLKHYSGRIHGAHKVVLHFRIVSMGEYFGTQLCRYYHAHWVKKNGSFKVGHHSDLAREYIRLFNERPERLDRIPMTRYKGIFIVGKVRTVNTDSKQKPLHPLSQYSVISELVKIKD